MPQRTLTYRHPSQSLNSADVFVYDPDRKSGTVFVWIGCSAIRDKKVKGREVAASLVARKYKHQGRVLEVVEPAGAHARKTQICKNGVKFWQMLGGDATEVAGVSAAGSDTLYERYIDESTHLFCLSGQTLEPVRLGDDGLDQQLLTPKKVYYVNAGPNELYVWIGRGATDPDVEAVIVHMSTRAEERMSTDWVHAEVVQQGHETLAFREKFISSAALLRARVLKAKAHLTAPIEPFALLPEPIPLDLNNIAAPDDDDVPAHLLAAAQAVESGGIAPPLANSRGATVFSNSTPRTNDVPTAVEERSVPDQLERSVLLSVEGAIGVIALFDEAHRGLRVVHVVPGLIAANTGKVFVGDRIVKVNKKPIGTYRRDRLIDILDHIDEAQNIELNLV